MSQPEPAPVKKTQMRMPFKIALAVLVALGVYAWFTESVKRGAPVTPFGPSEYTITVHGTTGTPFHGSIMVVGGGSSRSRSVEGVVPATFTETGDLVSVSFQKQDTGGVLSVTILKSGTAVKTADTSAEYGVVMAASQ